jgi:hypothetical protein
MCILSTEEKTAEKKSLFCYSKISDTYFLYVILKLIFTRCKCTVYATERSSFSKILDYFTEINFRTLTRTLPLAFKMLLIAFTLFEVEDLCLMLLLVVLRNCCNSLTG